MSIFTRLAASPIWSRLRQWRLFKFGVVGASGTLVNLGVLYAGQEFVFRFIASPDIRLNFSLGAAILIATINNFAWNRLWTWHDRPRKAGQTVFAQFGRYAIACWTGIVLQFLFTKLLAGHMAYLFANVTAIAAASAFNFAVNNLWTFRHRRAAEYTSGGS
jgi:dolichol-phosphate mannosyltransferase